MRCGVLFFVSLRLTEGLLVDLSSTELLTEISFGQNILRKTHLKICQVKSALKGGNVEVRFFCISWWY